MTEIDRVPRYAPDRVIIVLGKGFAWCPVVQYIAHPPGQAAGARPANCPINSDMVALECVTAHGSRWFGCEQAYINSELRMVTIGFDARDEVRRKWEVAKHP